MKFVVATLIFANAAAVNLEWGFGFDIPKMDFGQKPNLEGFGGFDV